MLDKRATCHPYSNACRFAKLEANNHRASVTFKEAGVAEQGLSLPAIKILPPRNLCDGIPAELAMPLRLPRPTVLLLPLHIAHTDAACWHCCSCSVARWWLVFSSVGAYAHGLCARLSIACCELNSPDHDYHWRRWLLFLCVTLPYQSFSSTLQRVCCFWLQVYPLKLQPTPGIGNTASYSCDPIASALFS